MQICADSFAAPLFVKRARSWSKDVNRGCARVTILTTLTILLGEAALGRIGMREKEAGESSLGVGGSRLALHQGNGGLKRRLVTAPNATAGETRGIRSTSSLNSYEP